MSTWKWQINATPNSSVNLAPATGAVAMFQFCEMLKQLGYTVPSSSDGTTYNSTGDQITSGATGAGGFGNNSAWKRLRWPDGSHEITIQRITTDVLYRVKLSHSARFTGGSPGATQTPSATDEVVYRGGGTDASPTGGTCFGTNGTYHLHCGGDADAPYHWWFETTASSGGAHQAHGWFLGMQDGSYDVADVAPYVLEFGSTTAPSASNLNGTPIGSGYFKKGLAGETFVIYNSGNLAGFLFGSAQPIVPGSTSTQQLTTDPYGGGDVWYPVWLGRAANLAQPGRKGQVDPLAMRFNGTFRAQFDTEDVTATAWAISTAYVKNQRALANGNVYRCTVAGTSAAAGGGPSGTSNAITDNTATWTFEDYVSRYTQFDVVLLRSPGGITLS